jgi:cation:H+ antiporter
MTLFLMADILAGRPVLLQATTSSTWLGGIGIVVTAVYALGLVVRPPRKVLRLGIDSWLVLVFYLFGIAGLVRISQ